MSPIELSRPLRIHVVGVGGAGMSAIAGVLAAMDHQVSGSDLRLSAPVERLRAAGVSVTVGHDADNVAPELDLVAVSTAIGASNVEVVEARRREIPVVSRAEILAGIAATRRTIAVAGTHGKTTTSSMLALVLVQAGVAPSFIIGGDLNETGSGSAWDEGDLFVVEADESDGTFLELPRSLAVVTNVEPDHIEHYGSVAGLLAAFERFVTETEGPVVLCADDDGARALAELAAEPVTYGTASDADLVMGDLRSTREGSWFEATFRGDLLGEVHVPVAGAHNARNAAAALATGLALGIPFEPARLALSRFAGVARRFEHRGAAAGVTFVDDYAHLPTEVAAALAAARDGGWDRVVCVFQPHRYSRTAALWREFGDAFVDASVVAVTDVYPSGEEPRPGVTGKLIVDAVLDRHPWADVAWLPRRDDVRRWLLANLRPGDLCLTLGAGDLTSLPSELLAELADAPGG
ncbi:MAG: UDP-N-acetylmuramate--L-alanine ligase [Acidimicrobiia bacterium]|nr:UDP-N-acetylmuramate--L-alanine ligase [Acidimicrobiia bacterium]